ncbi:MAG: flagellar hook-basal body complex protein [Lachnospiraceae bacterium]
MLRAMDSAVAGLRAHQNKLDVIGNNIANVNTFGFKSQSYSFKEAMYQTSTASAGGNVWAAGNNAAQYGYGTMTGSISTDMSASTPSYVGGFNATINGQGFFIVSPSNNDIDVSTSDNMKQANTSYTRVGQFSIDSNGYIVDSNNNYIMGFQPTSSDSDGTYDSETLNALRVTNKDGSYSTAVPEEDLAISTSIQINNLGIVTATITDENGSEKTVTLGKVAIATFQNPEGLTKTGGYYYETNQNDNAGTCVAAEPGSGSTPGLMTGYLEASNVDLAKEFSEMITTQRGFQANSKIITVSDEILSELVNMKR